MKKVDLLHEMLAQQKSKVIYVYAPDAPMNQYNYSKNSSNKGNETSIDLSKSTTEINNNLNTSACVVEDTEKYIKMCITEKIIDDHPKYRPPLSEARVKLNLKNLNSVESSFTPSIKTSTKLAIVDVKSVCAEVKIESELNETKPNIFKDSDTISGLNYVEEPSNLYVDALSLNLFIGRVSEVHFKKKKTCFQAMKSNGGLWALYKCMGYECAYFTSKKENFKKHLESHEQSLIQIKDFFKNCPYCFLKSKTPDGLIEHLDIFHKHCRYQCSECFYRSAEPQAVFDHCQQFHGKSHILECENVPILKKLDNDEIAMYSERIAKSMTVTCRGEQLFDIKFEFILIKFFL